jgi:hypothetical protein
MTTALLIKQSLYSGPTAGFPPTYPRMPANERRQFRG